MEIEEFYDSLDEEAFPIDNNAVLNNLKKFSFDNFLNSIGNKLDKEISDSQIDKDEYKEVKESSSKSLNATETLDISSTIPLYTGETQKQSNVAPKKRLKTISCLNLTDFSVKSGKKQSYLGLYRSRCAYTQKKPADSVRSVYNDANDEKGDRQQIIMSCERNENVINCSKNSLTSIDSSFYLNFESSLSPQLEIKTNSIAKSTTTSSRRKVRKNVSLLKAPVLGGLGPDPEANKHKLEMKRKQLQYGQKVSEYNRIKMKEKKVLMELKKEIKQSASTKE